MNDLEDVLNMRGPNALQDLQQRRAELARDIVAASYQQGTFVLSSGASTDYYLDKYLFETKPTVLRRLASLMAPQLPAEVDRLVGPEFGTVPIVVALALESGLPFAIVGRADGPSGVAEPIEGELHPGERVVVLEDVISSGRRILGTARRVRAAGADVVRVMAVIDRQEGAAAALAAENLPFEAMLTVDEILQQRR